MFGKTHHFFIEDKSLLGKDRSLESTDLKSVERGYCHCRSDHPPAALGAAQFEDICRRCCVGIDLPGRAGKGLPISKSFADR